MNYPSANHNGNHYTNGHSHFITNGFGQLHHHGKALHALTHYDEICINDKLPKELILKVFSYLDVVTLCHCSQVCKYWHQLAFDGSNWQYVSLFDYQKDIEGAVVEKLAERCGGFLRSLNLRGCQNLTDTAIKAFAQNCRNLEKLNISECRKLTNETCRYISLCGKLVDLRMYSCVNISDEGLRHISSHCQSLQYLDLSWCTVRDQGLEYIARNCSVLSTLIAKGCREISSTGVDVLANHCPELRTVNFNACREGIRDEALVSLARGCPELRTLCVSSCVHITDNGLRALAAHCFELRNLELASCHSLTDSGFQNLAKGCPNLERLDLEDLTQITDATVSALAIHCSHLQALSLSHCEQVTDEGIHALAGGLCAPESLMVLELDNCPLITDAALEHLVACHALQRIELYDCQLITRAGIRRLTSHLPSLNVHAYFAPVTPPGSTHDGRRRFCRCCTLL